MGFPLVSCAWSAVNSRITQPMQCTIRRCETHHLDSTLLTLLARWSRLRYQGSSIRGAVFQYAAPSLGPTPSPSMHQPAGGIEIYAPSLSRTRRRVGSQHIYDWYPRHRCTASNSRKDHDPASPALRCGASDCVKVHNPVMV